MADAIATLDGYVAILDDLGVDLAVRVKLYTNDPTITYATVVGDFVEPVYTGYGYQDITVWTPATIAGGIAVAVGGPVYFTWTTGAAPSPIRGLFVTHVATGKLLWAWRKPDPTFALGPDFPILRVTLTLKHPPV